MDDIFDRLDNINTFTTMLTEHHRTLLYSQIKDDIDVIKTKIASIESVISHYELTEDQQYNLDTEAKKNKIITRQLFIFYSTLINLLDGMPTEQLDDIEQECQQIQSDAT